MSQGPIKAVLFDIGDTLVDFGKVNIYRMFKEGARLSYGYLREQGQPMGNFTWYFWRNLMSLQRRLLVSYLTGNDFDSLEVIRGVGRRKGVELTDKQWERLAVIWYEPLRRIAHPEPETIGALKTLQGKGLKLGILSNTFIHGTSIEQHLTELGLLDFFPVRLYSYEFDFRKPDPRIFNEALRRLGEAPGHVLYVGDRIRNDIIPTLKLGMLAALKRAYSNAGQQPPAGAWVIDKLAELPAMIERFNQSSIASVV